MSSPALKKKSLLEGMDLTHPIYKGHMYKQAHSHKSFNKRYFVLYPKVLVYYDHEHDYMRDLERKTLEHRDKAYRLEGVYLSKPEKKPHGAKYCFILHCPHQINERKEVLLVAENREERRHWMAKLQEQNPNLLEGGNTAHSSSSTLEVPTGGMIRADSDVGLSDRGHSPVPQVLDVVEGSSDTEN